MSNVAATAAETSSQPPRRRDWARAVRIVAIMLGFVLVAMLAARSLAVARTVDEAAEEAPRIRAPEAPRMPVARPPPPRKATEPLPPLPPTPGPLPRPAVSTASLRAKPMLVRR